MSLLSTTLSILRLTADIMDNQMHQTTLYYREIPSIHIVLGQPLHIRITVRHQARVGRRLVIARYGRNAHSTDVRDSDREINAKFCDFMRALQQALRPEWH